MNLLTPIKVAPMTSSSITKGVSVLMDPLHLDELPGAMDKMVWVVGANMLRRWLNTAPAYKMPAQIRGVTDLQNRPLDYRSLPDSRYDEKLITMNWALTYDRVVEVFENIARHWNSDKGMERLRHQLKRHTGWDQGKTVSLGIGLKTARELEWFSQVNSRRFGEYTDVLDDFYAAMFQANMKVAVRGKTRRLWAAKSDVFEVEKLGIHMRDTYDFNADWAEELLVGVGVWSRERMLNKRETLEYRAGSYAFKARNYPGFVSLKNEDFRRWQDKNGSGGDFFVFSDVAWIDSHVDHVIL